MYMKIVLKLFCHDLLTVGKKGMTNEQKKILDETMSGKFPNVLKNNVLMKH